MSTHFDYIRERYHMPWLRRGLRCNMNGEWGTVTSALRHLPYIRVRFDSKKYRGNCHPTWAMTYYEKDGSTLIKDYKEYIQW